MQTAIDKPVHVRMRTLRRAAERDGCTVAEVRPRDIRRKAEHQQERNATTALFTNLDEGTPIKRVVTLSESGGFTLARYEGRTSYVFGRDEKDARSRLKAWDRS